MSKKRLIWQLFPSYLLITLVSLGAVTWYTAYSWKKFYLEHTAADLEVRARLVAQQVGAQLEKAEAPDLEGLCRQLGSLMATRITVIQPSGKVLADSERDPARMENHADRPEFQEALKGQTGLRTRFSYTLEENLMYAAIPLADKGRVLAVVRVALPVTAIDRVLNKLYLQIGVGGLVIALLAALLSLGLSRRLNRPLKEMERGAERFARGDLRRKVPVPDTLELGRLAEALNYMSDQLDSRIRAIVEQRRERDAVLASMVEGVMAVDHDKRLISLNQAAARLLQVNVAEVQQRHYREVVRNPELQGLVGRALAQAEPLEREIFLAEEERFLQVHGTPLRDSQGMTQGVVIVLNDVTRLRKLENTRREFVANVAHELKTPITSIKGFVETLLDGAYREPENNLKFLQILARQADRLHGIIEDLLTLSRIEEEAEQGKIFLTTGRLGRVLQGALRICESRAQEKSISLTLSCSEDLKAQINAPLLEQAVVNLVDNAIKYSEPGSTVQVKAEPRQSEVVIQVSDQGCGIAPEHLPRLFERFYRVDAGRSRKIGGTGLGLAIVKHIAQAHGGRATVESSAGQGSTFSIHLLPA